eukprot:CAMPEP_0203673758 /NCGR_PEP_ID=MMETSP0090-20130426/13674_1 /ASSEMBLY_ACC=CAM_ASM_001088 /TAXON_ID=426623 /ORGANISM="Chaetoceros affinis, Strain CCMP159" /LENGTH=351 /DNA_ID=CAMNT_0050539475 /DNA_START=65 /DNA_END=1120 /DNA_ORIENTATION=+
MTDYIPLVKKKFPHCIVVFNVCALLIASAIYIDSKRAFRTLSLMDMGGVQIQQVAVDDSDGNSNSISISSINSASDSDGTAMTSDNGPQAVVQAQAAKKQPIMHTFWEPVPGGCCGADEIGHEQLLTAWRNAWQSYGWETKLLTMADATSHPLFDEMSHLFDDKSISEYDKRCFYRWLAMATLEDGGWMSDYDLFPLNFPAEESYELIEQNGQGRFTSYAYIAPALVYASNSEWDRVVKLLMEGIGPFEGHLSDMYVFKEMVEVTVRSDVGLVYPPDGKGALVNRLGFEVYDTNGNLDCETLIQQKAIHFSHFRTSEAYRLGVFPIKEGDPSQNRGLAADVFMRDFKQQCL